MYVINSGVGEQYLLTNLRVSDLFSDITPIYTGEMMVKHDGVGSKVPFINSYHVLQDGRKLVFDYNNNKIQLYEPPHGKTNNLHMRKQRRRSASR